MKHAKKIAAAALAAAALTALLGAGSASATTLEVGGKTTNASVSITTTLKAGTSSLLTDTFGFSLNTCTGSEWKASTASPYTGATVTAAVSTLAVSLCERLVSVHKGGTLHIAYTSGTNGTVTSSGTEVTTGSPFGTLNCKTTAGTHLGTLTGVAAGSATMDVNAVMDCSTLSSRWTATFSVTSPAGLGVSK